MNVKLITISGMSGSGKSFLSQSIKKTLEYKNISSAIVEEDNYRICLKADLPNTNITEDEVNFDCPGMIDTKDLYYDISTLLNGQSILTPKHCFGLKPKQYDSIKIDPCEYIILEGCYVTYFSMLYDISSFKIHIQHKNLDKMYFKKQQRDKERGNIVNDDNSLFYNTLFDPILKNKHLDLIIQNYDYDVKDIVNKILY